MGSPVPLLRLMTTGLGRLLFQGKNGNSCTRLHGGLSPGAPKGRQNGNYKNGEWTTESIEEREWLRSLVRAFAQQGQDS
jgi:hypothetical protein